MELVYLGIFFVVVYTTIMCIHMKCIPPSISETFYHGGGVFFTITLFVSSILITMGLLDLSDGSPWQFVSFFTGAGIFIQEARYPKLVPDPFRYPLGELNTFFKSNVLSRDKRHDVSGAHAGMSPLMISQVNGFRSMLTKSEGHFLNGLG